MGDLIRTTNLVHFSAGFKVVALVSATQQLQCLVDVVSGILDLHQREELGYIRSNPRIILRPWFYQGQSDMV